MIHFDQVFKRFGSKYVVHDLSFEVMDKEFVALLGPSGCGKSTTLRILAGLEDIQKGKVKILEDLVTTPEYFQPPEERNLGMVFQDVALFPHLTISQNIAFGLQGHRHDKLKRVKEMLKLIGMESLGDQMPHKISGGQQQRVAVARALAPKPKLILLDEPFSNLDAKLRFVLRSEIRDLLKKENVSVILVTHDQKEAFSFADRILMMKDGSIIQSGTSKEIYQNPASPWIAEFAGQVNFIKGIGNDFVSLGIIEDHGLDVKHKNTTCTLMFRPEDLILEYGKEMEGNAKIKKKEFFGDHELLSIQLRNGSIIQAKVPKIECEILDKAVNVKTTKYVLYPLSAFDIDKPN